MKTALLVIDAQQSFIRRPYSDAAGMDAYLASQNALIACAEAAGWPIVRVLHHEPQAAPGDPFTLASGQVRALDGLRAFDAALTVHKTRHSALVGTGLDVWLTQQGVGRLVVSGIRTEQCCETTTRHASDLGWQVDFVLDATMTWPIALDSGGEVSAAQLRERTRAVLHGRFARVLTVQDLLRTQDALEVACDAA